MANGQHPNDGNPVGGNPIDFSLLDGRIRHVLNEIGVTPQQPGGSGGSGNGGGGGSMEPRIAQLELHTEYIKRDVSELRTDAKETRASISTIEKNLATLTTDVGRLPRKGFIVRAVLSALAVIAGLVTFQDQLRSFLHLH